MEKLIIDDAPPSDNHVYRRSRNGGMYLIDKGKDWKELVNLKASKFKPTDKKVRVEMDLTFNTKHKRDVTNYHKLTLDALEGRFYVDDRQIIEFKITKQVRDYKKTVIRCYEAD